MEQSFFFVNGIENDKTSKKLMRRHVMKGKNLGRTLTRSSRLNPKARVRRSPPNDEDRPELLKSFEPVEYGANWKYSCPAAISGNVGFSVPAEIEPSSQGIINDFFALTIDRMYPLRLGMHFKDVKSIWLRYLFSDEATYYCSISLMQACNEILIHDGNSSSKALQHLSRTFYQVRKRLESNTALSDSSISLVLSLVYQEQIRRYHTGAAAHLQGLGRMVELRGGLSQLEGNPFLVLKVCKTDIMFSLQNGQPTMFFRDRMPEVQRNFALQVLDFSRPRAGTSVRYDQLEPLLHETILDIESVCSLFNNIGECRKLEYLLFLETVISICYRLLYFRTLVPSKQQADIQAAYHIGSIIFMMTLFLQIDKRRIIDYSLISMCLKNVLDSKIIEHERDLLLWVTVMGGIWVSGDSDGSWILPRIHLAAQGLGYEEWHEVRASISRFPWLDCIHDEPGQKIWDQVRNNHQL